MKRKIIRFFEYLISSLLIIISIIFLVFIRLLNVIPDKYFVLGTSLVILLSITLIIFILINFKKKIFEFIKMICIFVTCILLVGYSYGIYCLDKTINLFGNANSLKEEITDYYIIVLKDSIYGEVSDLDGKSLSYFFNTDKEVVNSLKLDLTLNEVADMNTLKNRLYTKEIDSILISDIIKNKYEEEDSEFVNKIKILKTISIKSEIEDIKKVVSIKNTPFNVLISGIDTYGDINKTSRNDVNIVATINPNTNEILLTSIPRDYYVQIHGTTGYKDKLTHASYYGTNVAVATIEDLLNIDINYYVKVNFSTVVDLVDQLGGISVYADQSVSIGSCKFKYGYNNVDGRCALAFARERYSYLDGDRHRGRNQQEVIKAIFKKITSNGAILYQYTNLIESLDGKFVTNMDMNDAMGYVKYELEDLGNYNIESIQLTGSDGMGETYSYPSQKLYIMIPYEESIENAKKLIGNMLENKTTKSS